MAYLTTDKVVADVQIGQGLVVFHVFYKVRRLYEGREVQHTGGLVDISTPQTAEKYLRATSSSKQVHEFSCVTFHDAVDRTRLS